MRRNLGNVADLLKNVVSSTGGAKLIIRSNVTPEIVIDLTQISKPGPAPDTAVQGQNVALMNLIKPEVELVGLGVSKSIHPYGKPTTGLFTLAVVGAALAAAGGGFVAWRICRR